MTLTLTIEKLVTGGRGLARTPEGVVIVRGGLPGERVRARVRRRKNHLEGEVLEILEPSPDRVDHPLPPGADLPLAYEAQLPVKQGFVREALARLAGLEATLEPIAPSPEPMGYRTAAQFALHPLGGLAYRVPGSHELVRAHTDPLLAPPLQEALSLLNTWPLANVVEVVLRGSLHEGRVQVGLIGGKARMFRTVAKGLVREGIAGVWWGALDPRGRFRGPVKHLAGAAHLLEAFGEVLASVDVVSFAQVNPRAAARLYQEAAALVHGGRRAVELYAGGGVLSFHLAAAFDEIVAVELSRAAIQKGQADARRLGLPNVRFHRGDARELVRFAPADLVAVDPPRAGLAPEVVRTLLEARPHQILYISCDPATWARDVKRLVAGGYRLRFARPYDFYPFTHHVEVLSLLVR
ncbi:class I SAM-dependent RNA methyltransferase [Marinithermus hydrothermalis]|uniref:(Uracil-5)-methyltransferase n=1 Tax=Marinithermus hydrothermalis (strain DSM 14884 / JCM 11576 / T1) TaxID=869210 RepID=F2NPC9_MARHT|nr:methyltransferase domain-containing protein [Marinithermus hydrothermalis]AEB12210.1 (Uracil-5)-methyltransferase [Marinithermus hydrothermalis DSM 14884]